VFAKKVDVPKWRFEGCIYSAMTKDDPPRCRSDGKKGKGIKKENDKNIYSAKHIRLALAAASKNKK
jgi:hypothetical protein